MRQRDAEHTLQGTVPFRPESNSPSFRHCGQLSPSIDTCVPTLPNFNFIIPRFRKIARGKFFGPL